MTGERGGRVDEFRAAAARDHDLLISDDDPVLVLLEYLDELFQQRDSAAPLTEAQLQAIARQIAEAMPAATPMAAAPSIPQWLLALGYGAAFLGGAAVTYILFLWL